MPWTKKAKILAYLNEKQAVQPLSPFDSLLQEYLHGRMKIHLAEIGVRHIDIHVDWLRKYRCVNIQGTYQDFFLDIQIEPDTYSVAWDQDEADDAQEFALESAVKFYDQIGKILRRIRG